MTLTMVHLTVALLCLLALRSLLRRQRKDIWWHMDLATTAIAAGLLFAESVRWLQGN